MMTFNVQGKIALITGGASGIGLSCAKELLSNGLRGVSLVDLDEESGEDAANSLNSEFGEGKAIFIQSDVTDYFIFESAFRITIEKFKNIDLLINNAGLCNDSIWEREISVNVNGTVHGMLLGLENYIPKYKSDKAEGVIVNVSSIRGVEPLGDRPIYGATKFAVHGMTLAWGCQEHYQRTKVKVIGVCPGSTATPLIRHPEQTNLGEAYEVIRKKRTQLTHLPSQTPQQCAQCIVNVIKAAGTGTIWIVEGGETYRICYARSGVLEIVRK
ncbi:15-hydroxyprostaglandin dehydrogenase [NAD(+)]-like [Cylas formicarius]|uniref:15-hydroxyprostaglandin dehydrogenase [NAD(+)]-like n=1 Tax=Cylas formicarius TaxID=197179 RepID=UPI002958ACF2|nr:15-hydroxyprostaglandin dehydrogenase [NAD(+)]-like [Cylas formicarius]XP_060531359.1 15-hydroxyprostaglandin dehydrogenase [NAD(+)]-like [Cylas formicarius]XP_060531360.1 15-hydroxyprostaglandin dehydrogenase [NAD(+)]-like [Cylas formicarius]